MRIAIDISSIIYGTGVSVYTRELVKALAKIDRENEYVLFGGSLRRRRELVKWFEGEGFPGNFELKVFWWPPNAADVFWNQLRWPPLEWFIGDVDVMHSPDWTLPPTRAKKVVTIHDLYFWEHPGETDPGIYRALRGRLEVVKREADAVIAVSKATKRDVVRLVGIPGERVRVVYEASGLGNLKSQISNLETKSQKSKLLRKYNIGERYFLAVGTVEKRKNYARLVEAHSRIMEHGTHNKKYQLVIAGREGNAAGEVRAKIKEQKLEERVRLLGYVPKPDLEVLFEGAAALVFPSLYEGFGIPVLVGFSHSLPVVTSNVSSLPEVAGKAAIYVDPLDVGSIAGGMRRVVSLTKGEREKLVKKGYERLKKFSWEKAARETLAIYREVAGK